MSGPYHRGNTALSSNGKYYAYVLIPKHLRSLWPKTDRLKKSLKTKDPKQADINFGLVVKELHAKLKHAEEIVRSPESEALLNEAKDLGIKITELPETRQDWDSLLAEMEGRKGTKRAEGLKEENHWKIAFDSLWADILNPKNIMSGEVPSITPSFAEDLQKAIRAPERLEEQVRLADEGKLWEHRYKALKMALARHTARFESVLDRVAPEYIPEGTITFEQAHQLYKEVKGEEKADQHFRGLAPYLKDGRLPITKIDTELIQSIANQLEEQGLSGQTIRDRIFYPRRVLQHLKKRGHLKDQKIPSLSEVDIKGVGKAKQDRIALTREEILLVKEEISRSNRRDKDQHLFLFQCLAATGARINEIAFLQRKSIIAVDGIECFDLTTVQTKNSHSSRYLPIPEKLLPLLRKYMRTYDDLLFPFVWQKDNGLLENRHEISAATRNKASKVLQGEYLRAVIADKRKVMHCLRHSIATRLNNLGCPADIQRKLLGHEGTDVHSQVYVGDLDVRKGKEWLDKLEMPWLE